MEKSKKLDNLVRHKFTLEDQSKGGKASSIVRLNTNRINRVVQAYLDGNGQFDTDQFINDFKALKPYQRVGFLLNYLPYEKPKLSAVATKIVDTTDSNELTREQKEKRIIELLSKTG